jgi:hypothetical protein
MSTRYLFTMVCFRGIADKKTEIQTTEHIIAETWEQALEYWKIDMQCLNTEIVSMTKQVPVVAICPQDKRV